MIRQNFTKILSMSLSNWTKKKRKNKKNFIEKQAFVQLVQGKVTIIMAAYKRLDCRVYAITINT